MTRLHTRISQSLLVSGKLIHPYIFWNKFSYCSIATSILLTALSTYAPSLVATELYIDDVLADDAGVDKVKTNATGLGAISPLLVNPCW